MDAVNTLFALVKNTVFGQPVDNDLLQDKSVLPELFSLAKKHSLAQLIAHAVIKNNLLPADSPEYAALYKKYLSVVTRATQIQHEEQEIAQALEQEQIKHVMLKGAVMRPIYPEGWMRTSSDIDCLVPEEDLDRAVDTLTRQLGYRIHGKKNYHDICLVSPSGVPLELHFSILENMDALDLVLKTVWEHTTPLEGSPFRHRETPEFFLFHHLAHMAYHFTSGGCGIRFFLDLWIIQNKLGIDLDSVRPFTDKAGITAFAEAAFHLTNHWFADGKLTKMEEQMERYILDGGCFGSKRAKLSIQQQANGGAKKHLLCRIFPSGRTMKILYPWLTKQPWLIPIAHPLRWLSILNPKKRQSLRKEIALGRTITDEERSSISKLLTDLNLK